MKNVALDRAFTSHSSMYSATWGQPKVAQLYLEKEEEGGGEKRSGGRKEEKVSRRIKPEAAG